MNTRPGRFDLYPRDELCRISAIGGLALYAERGQEWMKKIGAIGGRAATGESKKNYHGGPHRQRWYRPAA